MRVMPAKDSRFVRKLYLIVTQEDAALVSWTPDGRAFTIHDTAGFQRAIKTKHHLSSLCTFRQNLRAHGFAEIEIGSSAAHDDISGGVSNNGSDVSVGNDAAAGRAPRSKTRGGSRSSDIVESSDSSTCSEDDDYDYERSSNSNARRKSDAVSAAMHSASHSSAQLPSPQAQASSALSASSSSAPPPETYFHPFFVRGHPELLERITFDASLKYRCQECKRHPNESGAKCSFRRRDASGASAARMPVSMSEWAPTSASVTATASKALVHSMSSGASAGASGVGNSSGTGSTLGSDSWSSSVASSSSSGMPQSATIGSSSLVVKLQAPRHHLDKNAALLAPSERDTRAAALPAPGSRGSTSTNTSMLSFASAFLRPSPSLLGAPASESAPSECQRQPAQTRGFVSQSTGSQTPAATSGAGSGSLVVRLSFGGRRDDSSSSNDGSRDGDRDAHTGAAVEATREAAHRRVDEATRDVRTISGAGASVGDGCKRLHNPTLPPDPPRTSGREQQQPSAPERFPFPLDIMNPAKPHRDGNDDSGDGDGESHGYSVSGATDVSCSGSSGDCRSHYAYEEEQDDQQPHHHDKHHQQQQSHQSHRQEQSQQSQRVVSARRNGTGIFKSQRLQAKTTNAVATKTMAKTVATKIVTATAETESKTVAMLSLPPPPSTVPSRRQSVEPASAAPTSAAPHTVLQTVSKRVEPVLLAIPKARSAPAGSTARAPLSTAAATKQLADLTLVPSVAPPMRITLSLGGARRHRRERQEHGGESRSGAQPMASVESVEPLRSGKRATSVDSAEMRGAPQPNASRKRARTSPAAASFPTLVTATATTPGAGDLRFSIKLPPSSASVERQPLARRGVAMASESSGSTEPSGAAASRGRGRALAHKLMPDEDGAAGGAVGEAVAETAVSVTPTPSAGSLSFRVKLPGRTSVANSSSNTIGNDRKRGGGGTDAHADSASERVGSKRLRGVCVAAALSPGSGSTPTLTPAPTDARVSQPRTQASRSKSLQARLVAKAGAVSGGTEDANALSLLVLASVKRQ